MNVYGKISNCTFITILNIMKSLVISSTRNITGLNLGWVLSGFFRWVFRVSTWVSEPCKEMLKTIAKCSIKIVVLRKVEK